MITRKPRDEAEGKLRLMTMMLRHEPFYGTGVWIDETLGVYVGWAARDKRLAEEMARYCRRRKAVLVFSGEQMPQAGAVGGLEREGDALPPAEADDLVDLCEGAAAGLGRLNGRFHGLLVERDRGTITLFNDRFGMHRLYYYESEDAFYFGAEAKAILATCPEVRALDHQGLGEFLACGCVLGDRTIFRNVRLLPPAAAWTFRNGAIQSRDRYFHVREWENQSPLSPQSYYEELRDAFRRNLSRCFRGEDAIALSLTGGLDTRAIMAWQKPPPRSLSCYTFGGMYRNSQDVVVARRVAKACGQTHDVIRVDQEFLSRFPHYAERSVYLTDGSVGPSRSPDLYVSERAREVAPVKIVGTYGSEILTQIPTFKPAKAIPGLFHPEMVGHIERAAVSYTELRREHPVTFAAFRQFPWWHYGILALEQTQLDVRSPYFDNEFVRIVFRAPRPWSMADIRMRLIEEGSPRLAQIRTDRGVTAVNRSLIGMAQRRLLEFTFRAEYAYDYGMPHWLARIDHVCAALRLERLFLGRHKPFHFRVWYREALSEYVREVLLDPRALSRGYVERKGLEAVVRGHLAGTSNYTSEIHKVLALELVHRLFVDAR
jgi:asparagine synthase (glutamine-hydrolysing)